MKKKQFVWNNFLNKIVMRGHQMDNIANRLLANVQ